VKYLDPDGMFDSVSAGVHDYAETNEGEGPNYGAAIGCYFLGCIVVIGTIVEDAGTVGIGITDDPASFILAGTLFSCGYEFSKGKQSRPQITAPSISSASTSSSLPPDPNNNEDDGDYYESSPKHHQNAKGNASQEPKNAKEMFDKSVKDEQGRRWYKDKDGVLHRFEGSNNKYHWNGSYEGKASQMPSNVQKLYRSLPKGEIGACW